MAFADDMKKAKQAAQKKAMEVPEDKATRHARSDAASIRKLLVYKAGGWTSASPISYQWLIQDYGGFIYPRELFFTETQVTVGRGIFSYTQPEVRLNDYAVRYTKALKAELAKDGIIVDGWKAVSGGKLVVKSDHYCALAGKSVWEGYTVKKAITPKSQILVRLVNGRSRYEKKAQLTLDGAPFEGVIGLQISYHE